MKQTRLFAVCSSLLAYLIGLPTIEVTASPAIDAPVYELRVYHCNPGKRDALHARFRDHTLKLFEKHGMTNIGYFVPIDDSDGGRDTLIYLLAHKSRDAAKSSWASFGADPAWKKAKSDSEKDGTPLVKMVESTYLDGTPYSPDPAGIKSAETPRVFELRTYTTSPGKLTDLHARFRDHTTKLFEKHGMTNVVYGVPQDAAQGSDDTLVYLLAFPSRDAAAKSWKAFGDDPDWQRVYKASQPDGVELAAKIKSIYMTPTDYSPIK